MKFKVSRYEEVTHTYEIEIEAASIEEVEEIYDGMRYTGEFFDEAELVSETVSNGWEEASYLDPDTGEEVTVTL